MSEKKRRNDIPSDVNIQQSINYDKYAISRIMERRRICKKAVRDIFGMSNPTTANSWIDGTVAPPISRLLYLCTELNIDPLEFVTYYGHQFRSRMEDLYLLEQGGKTVADILRELNIETSTESAISKQVTQEERYEMEQNRARMCAIAKAMVIKHYGEDGAGDGLGGGASNASQQRRDGIENSMELIDRIISMQQSAAQHEFEAVSQTRKDMQATIDLMQKKLDERDDEIRSLQRQVANYQAEAQMLRKYIEEGVRPPAKRYVHDDGGGHITSHKDVTDV